MAVRDPAPQPAQPEAAPGADTAVTGNLAADDAAADVGDSVVADVADAAAADVAADAADGMVAAVADSVADGVVADEARDGSQPAHTVLVPVRRASGRATQLPVALRSWRRHARLEPIGTTLRRVARHPAVVGSASAATVLVARAGVEVLRAALAKDRRAQPAGRVFVSRRVVVEYVETWSRSR